MTPSRPTPTRPRRTPARLGLEALEARDTPAITLTGTLPLWTSPGPENITGSSAVILGSDAKNVQVGAIEAVAVDPFSPFRVVVGGVNGGLWVTENYNAPGPVWTTTGDNLPSLAIASVNFSPTVRDLVFAGTGSYSAGGLGPNFSAGVNNPGDGGPAVGVYRSTDGGRTWAPIGGSTFAGRRVRDIVPTTLNGGNTVFSAIHDGGPGVTGVYRSDDRGDTWRRLSGANGLPDLGVTSLIADPGNPGRFFAAPVGGAGAGVYVLENAGAGNQLWRNVTSNLPPAVALGSRIVLASTAAGANPVFAAVVRPDGVPQGVYRAIPFGANNTYVWTAIGPGGLPPDVSRGQQGDVHFAISADPTSDRFVYVAGDRRDIFPFAGNVARGDAIADTWTTITANVPGDPLPGTVTPLNPAPLVTTAPHPDFRRLVFADSNVMLAATDGGLYRVTNPRAQNNGVPTWSSVNGNLRISELYQADLDNRNTATTADDVLLAAAQDNGQNELVPPGRPWVEVATGDGTVVRADDANGYRYYSAQFFALTRRNPDGTLVQPLALVNGTAGSINFSPNFMPFNPAFELNQADPSLILVGGNFGTMFLTADRAETFDSIGGVTGGVPAPAPNVTDAVTAIAFGTNQVRRAAYVATFDGNIAQSFDVTVNRGNFAVTNFSSVSGGAVATDVVMDPNNPLVAYAVSNNGVYRTTDAGTFVDINGNLLTLTGGAGLTRLFSLALMTFGTATADDDVLVAGGFGGTYFLRLGTLATRPPVWQELGDGIPNVVISDLVYDLGADTLVAGTYGRGVYVLPNATQALQGGPVVTVTGNAADNTLTVSQSPTNPLEYVVTDGLGNSQAFSLTAARRVVIRGTNGADTVVIGSPAGAGGRTTPLGLTITVEGGGQAGDTLVFDNSGDTSGRVVTVTPTSIGAGAGDTALGFGGSVTYTGFDNGAVDIRLGSSAADAVGFVDDALPAGTNLTITAAGITRAAGGTYRLTGAEQVAATGGAGNDTFTVRSSAFGLALAGQGGNDTFVISATDGTFGPLAGGVSVDGGTGVDSAQVSGTAAADSVAASVTSAAGSVALAGLPQPVRLTTTERVDFDGRGGANSFALTDDSDVAYGSPTRPVDGIVVAPSAPGAGTVRVGGGLTVGLTGISGGLTVVGDGNGSGDDDVLMVLGTSAEGVQSATGEAVRGDGRDRIAVTDTGVSVRAFSGSSLLEVSAGVLGDPTFTTIYVATGNEAGATGDAVTVTPSARINLVVDGQGPSTNPGDRVTVLGTGTFTSARESNPSLGPPQARVTNTGDQSSVGLVRVEATDLPGGGLSSGLVAVGADAGPESTVRIFDRLGGTLRSTFTPFPGFTGGVSVATGDVTGDGLADLIVGAGPGGGPRVAVFNGVDNTLIYDFFGYESTFRGGVNVSAGDFDGDGIADIVLGTGVGGGPRVRILSGVNLAPIKDVLVFNRDFRGGVNVATGDVNGDGTPDLVNSTGTGGGPRVVVLDGRNLASIASFFVFDPSSRTGFFAAAGDVNGDGFADIIVGSGAGAPAQVRVFSGLNRAVLADFAVNDPFNPSQPSPFTAGVRVSAADVNGDGISDVVTGLGPNTAPIIRTYQLAGVDPTTNALFTTLQEIRRQEAFDPGFNSGVFVGSGD